MKMTERYGSSGGSSSSGESNRKHKKHKTIGVIASTSKSSTLNNTNSNSVDNSLITDSSMLTTNGQQLSLETSTTKPLKLVLKVGQSGAYSPATSSTTMATATSFLNSSHNNIDIDNNDAMISSDSITNNNQCLTQVQPPPELLPLTVDSYHHNVDFTQINNSLKKSKKKKKKHHHHHHHSHSHHHLKSSDISKLNLDHEDFTNSVVNNVNINESSNLIISSNQSIDHSIDEEIQCSHQKQSLDCHQTTHLEPNSSNNNANDIVDIDEDDDDVIMGSMLMNQDSIFSSVDLIDIDSCSKLDISALVPEGDELNNDDDSRQSAVSSIMSQYQLNQRPRAKLRPTSSVYRQLLQKGQVRCDSNNLYEHLRRQEKMSMMKTSRLKSNPFQQFLISLLKRLQQKDPYQLFAWPVIDSLTPGYSQVIRHPMDFHTIRKKIEHNLYRSVAELKYDVRLLCENAIQYYRHSGIHYREASRLWYYAKTRVFARDQLAEHVKQFPPLTMADLGMDDLSKSIISDTNNCMSNGLDPSLTKSSHTITLHSLLSDTKCEPNSLIENGLVETEQTSEQILEATHNSLQLLKSHFNSEEISQLALARSPNDSLVMSRQSPDGTTTLPFVLPDHHCDDKQSTKISLGNLVGRLSEGTSSLAPYHEPDTERIKPYRYLEESLNNPFVSHLPYMDSSSSTISHQDTTLLFDTFEKYQPPEHNDEIERVANDRSYLMKSFVDSLLTIVSHGDYKPEEEMELINGRRESEETDVADEGETTDPVQKRLNETKELLERLETIQTQRLTKTTEPIEPTAREIEVAGKITTSLVDIIKCWFQPADIVDPRTIHKQLGIVLNSKDSE